MVPSSSQREHLIDEILDLLAANLSGLSDEELASLREAANVAPTIAVSVKAIQTPDESAMVHLNPKASKEAAVAALREIAGWLELNWEDFNVTTLAGALRAGASARRGPRWIN